MIMRIKTNIIFRRVGKGIRFLRRATAYFDTRDTETRIPSGASQPAEMPPPFLQRACWETGEKSTCR